MVLYLSLLGTPKTLDEQRVGSDERLFFPFLYTCASLFRVCKNLELDLNISQQSGPF
jgi:hypothetical protein